MLFLKKLGLVSLLMLMVVVISASAFITPKGNEISFIWGVKNTTMTNSSIEWIPRIDYPNGTIINGHFERIIHNYYEKEVPVILGISFNGIDYYKNRFIRRADDSISVFSVPIGHRGPEYQQCRQYEIDKGVCEER